MNISAIANTMTTQNTTGAPQSVDYKAFLQLLVAQMKNQDPTAPMESTDYVAQLATFSQVEQSVELNKKLTAPLQASTIAQATRPNRTVVETQDGQTSGDARQAE